MSRSDYKPNIGIVVSNDDTPLKQLADVLRERSLLSHHGAMRLTFIRLDGSSETYTLWAGSSEREYMDMTNQLNWSEH